MIKEVPSRIQASIVKCRLENCRNIERHCPNATKLSLSKTIEKIVSTYKIATESRLEFYFVVCFWQHRKKCVKDRLA